MGKFKPSFCQRWFWWIGGPIYYAVALLPTCWKGANNDWIIQSYSDIDRQYMGNGDRIGHFAQGAFGALSMLEIDWDSVFDGCCGGDANKNCCGFDLKKPVYKVCAAIFQGIQTSAMLVANLGYPIYSLWKRYGASRDGHYEKDEVPEECYDYTKVEVNNEMVCTEESTSKKQISFDGSFFSNYTDWLLGVSAAVALLLMGLFYGWKKNKGITCFTPRNAHHSSGGRCSAGWIREYVHKTALATVIVGLGIVAGCSIALGNATMDNRAYVPE